MHMQMVQCNAWLHFYPQIPRKEMRAATTLLYLNVRCCTGTYRTNPAMVSSYAYTTWWYKCKIAMHELHILHDSNFKSEAISGSHNISIYKNINFRSYDSCEVLKLSGGNSNNKVKASRPHRYVYLPSPKIKNVSYAQSECAPPVYKHSSTPKQT